MAGSFPLPHKEPHPHGDGLFSYLEGKGGVYQLVLIKSKQDIADERRREVAIFRRQGLTHRAIARALEGKGFVNSDNGEPWSYNTVRNDLIAITALARKETLKETLEHRAEMLEGYQEMLRLHWQDRNLEGARKVMADMREMLGTDAPQVIVMEQLQGQLDTALERLEAEFASDQALLGRIYAALSGQPVGAADKGASGRTGARAVN